jgi:hypothetical protein
LAWHRDEGRVLANPSGESVEVRRETERRAIEELAVALTPVGQGSDAPKPPPSPGPPPVREALSAIGGAPFETGVTPVRLVEFEGELRPVVREAEVSEGDYVANEVAQTRLYIEGIKSQVPLEERLRRSADYARWRYRGFLCGEVASL